MIFEVFTIKDKETWKNKISLFDDEKLDIYYLPEYYQTWIEYENAEPICIFAQINESKFLYPFFKKEIAGYELSDKYYDIFSAYGYGGVVSSVVDSKDIETFNQEFKTWCKQNNIIAEFIRENPSINQKEDFIRDADYLKVRTNVYLRATEEYTVTSSSARRNIRKAQNNLTVNVDNDLESIDRFIELYNMTADRLEMDDSYLFDKNYFYNHQKYFLDNTKIINIVLENRIIASTLFYFGYGKTVYHLGASDFKYQSFRANDYLFSKMIDESRGLNNSLLSLGGGTTDNPDDKLFQYKSKFGNDFRDVYIGKKIHNESIYNNICEQWTIQYPNLVDKYKNLFLKYRFVK